MSGNKLWVNGTSYEPHQLELLPQDILPERIKTRRRGNGIAFQGETAYFSNFFPCSISYAGVNYNCSEQAFQHQKAVTLERDANAHAIMLMSDPKKIKEYGDKIPTAKKWEVAKVNIMEEIVTHKFTQSPNLRNKLCDTLQLPLYESTTNKFWGCGLKLNSRLWNTGNLPGQNVMGQILMRVRAKLQDRRPPATASSPSSSLNKSHSTHTHANIERMDGAGYTAPPSSTSSAAHQDMLTSRTTTQTTQQMNEQGKVTANNLGSQPEPKCGPEAGSNKGTIANEDSMMDTGALHDSLHDSSTNSSLNLSNKIGEIVTDGELDGEKIKSWKLPRPKRFTIEDGLRVNRSDRAPYNTRERRDRVSLNKGADSWHSTPSKKCQMNRSYINSNYKKDLETMGFNMNSLYMKTVEHYNYANVTSRRSNTNSSGGNRK